MKTPVTDLSFHGNWAELLPLLRRCPHLANSASDPKGYTPLHQAAWHSASLALVGELLALGANPALKTHNKHQTAQDIVIEKHPGREDLKYILAPGKRTLAQLMRKIVANTRVLFHAYDGNQTVCDRLIECFTSDSCHPTDEEVDARIDAAFRAVTGCSLSSLRPVEFGPNESFTLTADGSFWKDRFLPLLREYTSRAHIIPIEKEWAVVSDLFDPAPRTWGLRGDLFLWMEMRQALCHVEIPEQPQDLAQTISSTFSALTGRDLTRSADFLVNRFARGGMSSGMICSRFWSEEFIPLLQQRSGWLHEAWRR